MMTLGLTKKRNTVIMDGSDPRKNGKIIGMIGALAYPNGKGTYSYHPIDEQHPNMYIVEYRATERDFRNIQKFLDEYYPGLCIHNVAV